MKSNITRKKKNVKNKRKYTKYNRYKVQNQKGKYKKIKTRRNGKKIGGAINHIIF